MQASDSAAYDKLPFLYINADSVYAVSSRSRQVDIKSAMRTKAQTQVADLSIKSSNMFYGDRSIRKHWIEWMRKIINSLSVLIFFFIGAPLGAIIRKGGLGVPVLISVFTYILFYITNVSGEKMCREGEWSIVGCWFSVMVLAPFSIFFTVKANGDSTLFQFDVILEFIRYWFGTKVSRNITRKDVVIDDPDRAKCIRTLEEIESRASALEQFAVLNTVPGYGKLFFGSVDTSDLKELDGEIEALVAELGNSRDRVELDMLNQIPLLQIHGVQSPFNDKWVNRIIGIVFPVGLLFELRAWLFQRKLKRQMVKTSQAAVNLIDYLKQQTK